MRPLGMHMAMRKAGGEAPPAYWGLCLTAEEDGSAVAMAAVGSAPAVSLETSYDGEIWEPFYVGETSITLNNGERVYFRAGESGNTRFATNNADYVKFVLKTGKVSASGDITSLLNRDTPVESFATVNTFAFFFRECSALTSAPDLPTKGTTNYCYYGMFVNCSSLTSIKVGLVAWGVRTTNWMMGVNSTGTFYCPTALGTNETITRGASACPTGWTVINTD